MSSSTVSKLEELAGLEGAKRAVQRFARPDSPVHAVLLYGAEGAGKEKLANALAQAWLCTQPTLDGACGVCKACESFERQRSADFLRIAPTGKSDWIKQSAIVPANRKPDEEDEEEQVIPLIEFFRTSPLSARNKVAKIVRADRLYSSASNAFLKTLEEPQPYGKIVMTTSEIGRVLPTIVSRCVCVPCELPETERVRSLQPEALPELVEMSEGAPGRLAHIVMHAESYSAISDFALRLVVSPPTQALAVSEEFRAICDRLQDSLKNSARAANVEGLRALGAALSGHTDRYEWFLAIAEAHRRVQGNCNPGTTLDAMFARMLLS